MHNLSDDNNHVTSITDHTASTAEPVVSSYICLPDGDGCPVYSFVTQTLFVGFFCLLGLFGNSISWYVFFKTKVKSSTLFLFQSLSVVDNFLLLTVFPVFCLEPFVRFTGIFTDYLDCGYKFLVHVIFFPWASVSQTATVWLTVLVGLNRYMAVCRPYQTAKLNSIHQSKIQLAVVLVFSLLYNIPKFFETFPVSRDDVIFPEGSNETTNETTNGSKKCWCLAFSSYYMNETYIHGYESIMYTIFLLILPLSMLAVLNVLLVRQLKRLKRRRAEMQSVRQQHDDNVTLVLIIVVLVFIVCQSPALINRLMWSFYEDTKRACPGPQYYFSRLSNLLVVANSSVNFFIYYFFNLRFRQVLSQTSPCIVPFGTTCNRKSNYSDAIRARGRSLVPSTNRVAALANEVQPVEEGPTSATASQGLSLVVRKTPCVPVETKFAADFETSPS